ncbi:MAG: protein-tyrosine-phosphatase [Deltaproteobacteria bacterium]|nr:MAG: protein-tyrosine-phosphatase [Deltaproteobacteria bacterium]
MGVTSAESPIGVGWIWSEGPGRVGLTFAPGKHEHSLYGTHWERSLSEDLDRLRDVHAVDALVCLLEDHELEALGLSSYPAEAARRGIALHRLPIRDGDLPASRAAVAALLATVDAAVDAGRTVVIHCKGGLGRAGTLGGCWLRHRGLDADAALARLRKARGPKCPENPRQRRYIVDWHG